MHYTWYVASLQYELQLLDIILDRPDLDLRNLDSYGWMSLSNASMHRVGAPNGPKGEGRG